MSKRTLPFLATYALSVGCNPSTALDPTFGVQASGDSSTATTTFFTTSDGDDAPNASTTSNGSGDGSSGGPTCGNGILEDGELCDDGNTDDTDACTAACVPAGCGDGVVQVVHEECDEGALNGPNAPCNADCKLNVCGDGDRGPDEPCDDGNTDDTDACTSLCEIASCGDGLVHVGTESCDAQGDSETCDGDCTPAECGDGYANLVAGEECDDGNKSSLDNCYPSCKAPTMLVFITSEVYQGDLGGLAGADAKCQSLAKKAGVVGTFKAWLGTSDVPSATRLYHSPGRYKQLDGVVVADNFESLRNGPMHAPVTITETKQNVDDLMDGGDHDAFWSGEGGFSDGEDGYCNNWTSSSWDDDGSITATYVSGYGTKEAGSAWTSCYSSSMPLLCVQQAWYPEDPAPS
jgi:cysteine-rich repeat protein